MITREQAATLKMGDKLVAYYNSHVRIGEAAPVDFKPCLFLSVRPSNGDEPRIIIAFNDCSADIRGGRLFLTMEDALEALRVDDVEMGRERSARQEMWIAYFKADADINGTPGHTDIRTQLDELEQGEAR